MFKISFEFDEASKEVSNIKVTEIEKRVNNTECEYEVLVEQNKLRLLPSAIKTMGLKPNDRISVQYISLGTGKSAPVILFIKVVFPEPTSPNKTIFVLEFLISA